MQMSSSLSAASKDCPVQEAYKVGSVDLRI